MVTSSSKVEHYEHLKIVFEKLTGAGMTVNVSKCKFFREEIPFLGHVLTGDGVKIDPTKLESLKLFPRPINIKTLRGFLGICNYHRRCCPKYSKTLQPLYQLLKKGVKWKWDDIQEKAINMAKESIINSSQLYHPDLGKEFHMETDASDVAIAGRLYQVVENEQLTIAYYSRKLTNAETNYYTCEKELLAIIACLLKWKTIVMVARIIIWSDHKSLSFLLNCQLLNPRLTRWYLKIQNFNFGIKHIEGRNNIVADALSRLPYETLEGKDVKIANIQVLKNTSLEKRLKNIQNLQHLDEHLGKIIDKLNLDNTDNQQITDKLYNGVLFHYSKVENSYKIHVPDILKK